MKSFLVMTNVEGSIIEKKWCDPETLITKEMLLIQDVFEYDHRDNVRSCLQNGEEMLMIENLRSMSDHTEMQLFCFKSKNGVYFCAIEQQDERDLNDQEQLRTLISRFLFIIQLNDQKIGFENPESTRYQFEEIQMLNNELVNTKRMLEKSNGQLNTLNRELNNRLVKDPLTGLVSRYQYRSEIEYQISQNPNRFGIFMFMDIDDFKSINDTYGHGVGDSYLVEFANRLKNMPLPDSVKLRIAGDEFGIFVYGLQTVEGSDFQRYWQLIEKYILEDPCFIEEQRLMFSLSVGMAVFGLDTKEVFEIIEYADFAMYCAKREGKNRFHRFDLKEYIRKKVDHR